MSTPYETLAVLVEKKKLSANDKRWFTNAMNAQRKHEMKVKMLEWFHKDPDAKLFVGMASGAVAALAGTVLGELISDLDELGLGTPEPEKDYVPDINWTWLLGGAAIGGAAGAATALNINKLTGGGGSLESNIASILQLGGTGFAGSCLMLYVLKQIFTGTDLGELLSGIGEILPL